MGFVEGVLKGNCMESIVPVSFRTSRSVAYYAETILERDTWTPVLRTLLKGNCLEGIVRASFRTPLSYQPYCKVFSLIWLPKMATMIQCLMDSSGRPGDNTAVFKTIFFHLDWLPHRTSDEQSLN